MKNIRLTRPTGTLSQWERVGVRQTIALILLFATSQLSFASFSSSDRGTTTANFLRLGAGARAMAMGEAFTAVADDASALYWNPAGLTRLPADGGAATFMHAPYLDSSFYDFGGFAQGLGSAGAWGASAQYFSAGSITQTDRTGQELGDFTPSDFAGALSYAHGIAGAGLGVTARYIHSQIIDSAQAVAADAGLLLPPLLQERLRLGFVATNLGTRMKFHDTSEDLPLAYKAGAALRLSDRWLVALDVGFPKANQPEAALGTEYVIPLASAVSLAGRAGFNSRTVGGLGGVTGLTVGAGFLFRHLSIDYAFLPMGELGLTHRISLSFRWGSEQTNQPTASTRSMRRAERPRQRCEDLYGTVNCRDIDQQREERVQPGNPEPSPRPW